MDMITQSNLRQFCARESSWCVSIFLPTRRTGTQQQRNPIRLKNLLREAEQQLLAAELRKPAVSSLWEPVGNRSRAGVSYIFRPIRPTKRRRADQKHGPDPLESGEMRRRGVNGCRLFRHMTHVRLGSPRPLAGAKAGKIVGGVNGDLFPHANTAHSLPPMKHRRDSGGIGPPQQRVNAIRHQDAADTAGAHGFQQAVQHAEPHAFQLI
jgi:hypothetical protein